MLRTLFYHWRIHLAVLVGSAIATAVLTGALIVGDSVRGSLRDLTLERLGNIDQAVLADRFFNSRLAREIGGTPHILLTGSASTADEGTRASGVQILGVEEAFSRLYGNANDILSSLDSAGGFFPPVVINKAVQRELNVEVGEDMLLTFEDPADVHRDFLLGSRNPTDLLETRRVQVVGIMPDTGAGRFGLRPFQAAPRNAFMRLADLQKALGRQGGVNAAFRSLAETAPGGSPVETALNQNVRLEDLSLTFRQTGRSIILESPRYYLSDPAVRGLTEAAAELGLSTSPALTYLANAITCGERSIPYSTVSALDPRTLPESEGLTLLDGSPLPELGDDDILLNAWTADALEAHQGDRIRITYYQPEAAGELIAREASWQVRGIVAMTGAGADPSLTPEFPGIENADDIASWDAPFPLDLTRIKPGDEAYWDRYGAAPKAFISLAGGRKLWSSRFGSSTSVRLTTSDSGAVLPPVADVEIALLSRLNPLDHGFVVAPLRQEGLQAAEGATDFSGLFIGFSFFLIVSAALLVALLFRLGVETRFNEIGLLLAVGYPFTSVRRMFLMEGAFLAVVGAAPGLLAGVGYADLMILGLTTWWKAAVGTSHLVLHVQMQTLVVGFALSVLVVLASIVRSLHALRRRPVRHLLTRSPVPVPAGSPGKAIRVAIGSIVLAGALLAAGQVGGAAHPGLFFGSAALLLSAGLAFLFAWLTSTSAGSMPTSWVALQLGIRNTQRRPGRSLLCAALIGFACFVIVAVGANRRPPASLAESLDPDSGTGGYNLMARTDVPLYQDLASADDRAELGFSPEDGQLLDASRIDAFPVRSGDDASCLNLYRPRNPTVIGASSQFVERGGFRFARVVAPFPEEAGNPWRMLHRTAGAIPTIADANSLQWILHLSLGDHLTVSGPEGKDARLHMSGMLQGSIFQSDLIISEERFRNAFPGTGGYKLFLIRTEPEDEEQVIEALESALGRFGMDVVRTADRLSTFGAVENTYLSTFQTLGGLGLLLGTIGLGVLLFRNVLERTGELGALRAFGYRQAVLQRMLLAENGFLLIVGIGIGSVAALVAVAPHVVAGHGIAWDSLLFTLLLVFFVGLLSSAVAASTAMRRPLLAALREDR